MATKGTGLSAAEKKAVKERAAELRASQKKEKLEQALLASIAEMPEDEGRMARQVHDIVTDEAPHLTAKTWYGMPAWADDDGKVVLFFQGASTFDARYSTLGFNDAAHLDQGSMWPTAWALTALSDEHEQTLRELVRRAVGAAS